MKRLFPIILLVVACGSNSAATTSPSGAASTTASASSGSVGSATMPADAIAVRIADFKVTPAEITSSGTTLHLFVTNDGPTIHNLTIKDQAGTILMGTKDLRPGESELLSGAITNGDFVTFCSLPGHASLGLKGTLTVNVP